MEIAYLDCFSGVSGDMFLGAFLDAGLDLKVLRRGLAHLHLEGYEIRAKRAIRGEIVGTKFSCIVTPIAAGSHRHTSLKSILGLIKKSGLPEKVKGLASKIFTTVGKAESSVHGCRLQDVRFHEVGNIDSIVDIVGAAIAVHEMGVEKFYCSDVVLGKGYTFSHHGLLPVPSPATLNLMKGVPVRMSRLEAELVTPTGAGIVKVLCDHFGPMPPMYPEAVGYGAGSADFKSASNMLRVVLGNSHGIYTSDSVLVLETNIDDMSPQVFDYLFERLFKEGALDVYVTPIQMKKSRPAFQLSAIVRERHLDTIAAAIFEETTSIGLRYYRTDRLKLERKIEKVRTKYGVVKVKVGRGPRGIKIVSPEYEDCVGIAKRKKIPFKVVHEEARRALKP